MNYTISNQTLQTISLRYHWVCGMLCTHEKKFDSWWPCWLWISSAQSQVALAEASSVSLPYMIYHCLKHQANKNLVQPSRRACWMNFNMSCQFGLILLPISLPATRSYRIRVSTHKKQVITSDHMSHPFLHKKTTQIVVG